MNFSHQQGLFSFGNAKPLECCKTAFFCSRKYPAGAVLPIYDWAKESRDAGECVISGFQSLLERDVLEILLRGNQPIILAVARGLPKRYDPKIKRALNCGRLLVISPFPESVKRITVAGAHKRNEMMIQIADRIVIGYATPGGVLAKSLPSIPHDKEIIRLTE